MPEFIYKLVIHQALYKRNSIRSLIEKRQHSGLYAFSSLGIHRRFGIGESGVNRSACATIKAGVEGFYQHRFAADH